MAKVFRGDRLKELREKTGLSQDDLADRLGIGHAQMNRYEQGKNDPGTEILVALARELNTTTDYLLGLVDKPSQQFRLTDLTPDERQVFDALQEAARLISARNRKPEGSDALPAVNAPHAATPR